MILPPNFLYTLLDKVHQVRVKHKISDVVHFSLKSYKLNNNENKSK